MYYLMCMVSGFMVASSFYYGMVLGSVFDITS